MNESRQCCISAVPPTVCADILLGLLWQEAAWLEDNAAWPVSGPPSEEYKQEPATEGQMPSEGAEADLVRLDGWMY